MAKKDDNTTTWVLLGSAALLFLIMKNQKTTSSSTTTIQKTTPGTITTTTTSNPTGNLLTQGITTLTNLLKGNSGNITSADIVDQPMPTLNVQAPLQPAKSIDTTGYSGGGNSSSVNDLTSYNDVTDQYNIDPFSYQSLAGLKIIYPQKPKRRRDEND